MLTAKALIDKGLFSEKLIPPFKSSMLAELLGELPLNKIESYISEGTKQSKCCLHSVPSSRNIRRNFSIPNPLHQIRLAYCIENNWNSISGFINQSQLSLSIPDLNKDSGRSFDKKADWREYKQQCAIRSTAYRIFLKTDISRYYQTIYTHSIPWALYGKPFAKQKENRGDEHYGNYLDKCVRSTMDNQTIGIPTGPDTSHIISEIIGRAIECKLLERNPKIDGVRYVDDFALFFNSRHDAEVALHNIHDALKYFELEVNPNKTEIVEFPTILEYEWVSNLRHFNFRDTMGFDQNKASRIQNTDIINYFSRAFEYFKKYPNDSTLLYAISRVDKEEILKENWSLFESFILKSAILDGKCLPKVIGILDNYSSKGYELDLSKINDVITEIIEYHSKFSHGYEIAWSLWLAKKLNITINKDSEPHISKCDDSIVALIALDLRESELISREIDTSKWKEFMVEDQLYDDHWLLAYEANIKNWITDFGDDYIEKDPFFKFLKGKKVEFYHKDVIDQKIPLAYNPLDYH